MALPNRDAERLDHALDAQLQGRKEKLPDPGSDLVKTFSHLLAMNDRVVTDSALQHELWRTMMTTRSAPRVSIPPQTPRLSTTKAHRIRFVNHETKRRRMGTLRDSVVAMMILIALIAGAIGYRQYGGDDKAQSPKQSPLVLAQVATPVVSDAPVASDCTSEARQPGTVEALAGTTPTIAPALPRFGNDPIFDETAGTSVSDGEQLLQNSVHINGTVDGVDTLLQQLVACRFFNGPSAGARDLNGRYFALFSDDFFRRELAGYKEAGKDINLVSTWMPSTIPTVVETRLYDSRLLVVLQKANDRMTAYPILMLAWSGFAWQVDEVGTAEMPPDWAPAIASTPPSVGEVMGNPRLDISLYDAITPQQADNGEYFCPTPEPGVTASCGQAFAKLGPYLYNELPADTDFTLSFSNIGSDTRRLVAEGLGIDVEIAPGASTTFVVNIPAGDYPFEIYVGDDSDPSTTDSFTFAPSDQQRSVG